MFLVFEIKCFSVCKFVFFRSSDCEAAWMLIAFDIFRDDDLVFD